MAPAKPPASAKAGNSRKSKSSSATRDRLLQAAIHIIQTQGVERLTLDAVAANAEVSKGGLLYHFSTKEALVTGVIQHVLDEFEGAIADELAQDKQPDSPGRWLRAYVKATFHQNHLPAALVASLFSAVAINPELLEPVQSRLDALQQQLQASELDPIRATLVRLVTEGLGTTELFGLAPPDESLRSQLLEMLLALIQEAES